MKLNGVDSYTLKSKSRRHGPWVVPKACDDDERNCAIMWQLLLHRILFRTRNPDRGGERANRTTCCAYSKRLGLFRDEQFHALVHAFLKDADAAQERASRRSSADDASTLWKVLSLV